MENTAKLFGSLVFNDTVMREKLPKAVYKEFRKTTEQGKELEVDVANVIANAMKDWAVEKGVTHFTHWFQPMTGITAEKHDSFISPVDDSSIILEFSGKELIKGEPDASSFPNGGTRSTFEARGYTVWDTTSYAFIKDGILCIPTAFCGYSGVALDKKTPLLRSMEVINEQALRITKLFGQEEITKVTTTVGPEQEYFLIDKSMYIKRPDLVATGRTLFGARPPKGQDLDDHYFGSIKKRVSAYMKELDEELWKLGIFAKTKHNEVAPAQHELAPIFTTTNVATDQNQLTMELMKTIASKHDMACLLHEKPFAGVNGSGKHNNWSLSTNTGENLLEPGNTPSHNARFLIFLAAVIKSVDKYQDLLRISVASAGNDHRLGANEAPPAIVSIFLGAELEAIIDAIEHDKEYSDVEQNQLKIGASVLPKIPQDTTDRNRTSPFAFTGNKFEFRMLGSAFSISGANIILNTIVAEALDEFATKLEKSKNFEADLHNVVRDTIKEHRRIIFNGDGYSSDWEVEAEKRGLLNLRSTVDALPTFIEAKNIEVFGKYKVFTEEEMHSRYEILLENYSKTINIEALTMIDLANKEIIPSSVKYQNEIATLVKTKKDIGIDAPESARLMQITDLSKSIFSALADLEDSVVKVKAIEDSLEATKYYHDTVLLNMNKLRIPADQLEMIVSSECWTLPSYHDILNSIN